MKKNKSIDILLPCYNEEKTIREQIKRIKKIIKNKKYNYNIVVCDNNSSDNSRKIARDEKVKVLIEKEQGYGATLLNEINKSKSEYIVMLDCDLSYNEKHIPNLIAQLESGYDLVIGNRFNGNIEKGAMPILHRFGSKMLTEYANLLFRTPSHDYHCGLRAFKREKILECNLETKGFEFASEMIIKAKLNKLKIKEIPTDLFVDGRDGPPHLKTIKDGYRHFKLINKIKFDNSYFFRYVTTFLLFFLLLFCFSFITALIPHKVIEKNSSESINQLNIKFGRFMTLPPYAGYERYGDVRNFTMIYYEDEKHPVKSLIEKKYPKECDEELYNCSKIIKKNNLEMINYSRYWQGQSSLLKILAIFFDIKIINIISLCILIILFILTFVNLWKKDKLFSIAFFLASLSINIFYTSTSFQYVIVFLIMLIGVNIIIKMYDKKSKYIDIFFLIIGILTCYFDFLTCETLTLTMPLLVYFYLKIKYKEKITYKELFKYCILWLIGYAGMFFSKWIITYIYLGNTFIDSLKENLFFKISDDRVIKIYNNPWYSITQNIRPVFPFVFIKNGTLMLLGIMICIYLYSIFYKKQYRLLSLICLIPITRFLILVSHSSTLPYMTYRAILPTTTLLIIVFYDIIHIVKVDDDNEKT